MKKFNLIYEQFCLNNELQIQNNELQHSKEYRSLELFKHFCDRYNILVKFILLSKLSYIVRLYLSKNDKELLFDYYYKFNPHYYSQHKEIFSAFLKYKLKFIVTIDGTLNTKKVLF